MATITARKITETGLAGSTTGCATGGDEFKNSGIEVVRIANGHASQGYKISVTAQTTAVTSPTYGSLTKSGPTVTVSAGGSAYLGPFKQAAFNDSDGKAQLTYLTTGDAALSTIGVPSVHKLTVEVLYLDNK
tara:strand:+ start:132 stop:527 length:396 start_codon:yes stop_codon:yes gene_type:complete